MNVKYRLCDVAFPQCRLSWNTEDLRCCSRLRRFKGSRLSCHVGQPPAGEQSPGAVPLMVTGPHPPLAPGRHEIRCGTSNSTHLMSCDNTGKNRTR